MSALDRKLLRELWRMKTQALAIVLLCGCAVAVLSGSVSTYRSLQRSLAAYYDSCRFADVFASLRRAPESLAPRIAAIPGVAEAETRLVTAASLELRHFPEPVTAQIFSLPAGQPARLNRVHVRTGRYVERPGEVLASEGFATVQRLGVGDVLQAVVGGRRLRLVIVGIAISPEHVYAIRAGDMMPDDKHFGILYTSRDGLAPALDMHGAFNSVTLRLAPGAAQAEVIAQLDRLLEPYGGLGAFGRDEHVSHRFISDEIRQLKAIAAISPAIFLGVAAFVLSVVLSRLVAAQRQLIGTLKALGFTNAAVGLHYVKLVVIIVLLGGLAGAAGGQWLGTSMTEMYAEFYRFPVLTYELEPGIVVLSAAAAILAVLGGVGGALRRAASLRPAEAMRPEPPASCRPTLLERIGLHRLLAQPGRIVLRNLGRRPARVLLTALGIASSVAILVTGAFVEDSLAYMGDLQFERAQREDATVSFTDALAPAALHELKAIPGVRDGEPFRAVPATLRAGHRSYRLAIVGLAPGATLHRIVDRHGALHAPPPSGVLISAKLAEILDVTTGAALRVEVLDGRRPVREVRVAALVDDLLGVSATMSLPALNALLGDEQRRVSGAFLALDRRAQEAVYDRLMRLPRVAGVTLTSAMRVSFRETMSEYLLFIAGILVISAVIIAAGVVYNSGRVALAEREHELATLRIVGMTLNETWLILAGELAVQALLAIPIGCALGYGFSLLTAMGFDTDLYRIPVVITRSTYAFAAVVVLSSAALVALSLRHRIGRLDLVAALKAKE